MHTKHPGIIESINGGVVAAIIGTGAIVQATVDTITKVLGTTIKDAGSVQ